MEIVLRVHEHLISAKFSVTSHEVVREPWQHWLLAQARRHQEFVILVTDFQQSKNEPLVASKKCYLLV